MVHFRQEEAPARRVLTLRSTVWLFYDKRGIHAVARGPRAERAALTSSSQAAVPLGPWQVHKLRRVPWHTPHTFTEDGELKLTEAAEGWLKKAMKERKTLAEEAKADAGESDFEVDGNLRSKWLVDQEKMPEMKGWIKDQPELYRRSKLDGVIERLVKDTATNRELWLPVVPEGHAAGHVSWKRWFSYNYTWECSEGIGRPNKPTGC